MMVQSFEIRVALVGYVSVGKSTVLNALLGDKYSEVSMHRTTAGVNCFRVSQNPGSEGFKNEENEGGEGKRASSNHLSYIDQDKPKKSAKATHDEIFKDNRTLRSCPVVQEKVFDIVVDDPICEMRADTQLVIVDIPGINEADSNKKYKDYVESTWNTFDCVVVVMDAIQGVNTQEQVELLNFVQTNNVTKKDVPTIILGNKMDDPEDAEKLALVQETRKEVMKIFGKTCSESYLGHLLKAAKAKKDGRLVKERVGDGARFIPISAMNAFIYRKATHLTLENFKQFDDDIVDRIGQAEVGRKWKKLSDKQKVEVIRGAISDPSEYKERLEGTNFQIFLAVLGHFIGGKEVQSSLLSKQIDVCLSGLGSDGKTTVSDALSNVFKKCNAVGRSTKDLPIHFWRMYELIRTDAEQQTKDTLQSQALVKPFTELKRYYALAGLMELQGEPKKAVQQMISLVQWQLSLVKDMVNKWTFLTFHQSGIFQVNVTCCGYSHYAHKGANCTGCNKELVFWNKPECLSWNALSPHDWIVLIGSILLPSNEMEWYKNFGKEKFELEEALTLFRVRFNGNSELPSGLIPNRSQTENHYVQFICDEQTRESVLSVHMPKDISDHSHWGHLSWKYVEFSRSIKRNIS